MTSSDKMASCQRAFSPSKRSQVEHCVEGNYFYGLGVCEPFIVTPVPTSCDSQSSSRSNNSLASLFVFLVDSTFLVSSTAKYVRLNIISENKLNLVSLVLERRLTEVRATSASKGVA